MRLTRVGATARARAGHLHATFTTRYASARRGTVIAQRPRAGTRVDNGSRVRLTLSKGPAPVEVPVVGDASTTAARDTFSRLGLHTTVTPVAAPGIAPGTVVRTSPGAGHRVAAGSTVALFAAEVPQWRPLTTITGTEPTTFRIRGTRWRIVYQMAYHGTCTWIFFCSGPHAQVTALGSSTTADTFGLNDGGTKTETFDVKPGTYSVRVIPGGDEARWSLQVQDDY
jgi:PASTA domain